jgi:amino acid adenylation domain-containing protein
MKKPDKKNIEDIFALSPMQEGLLFHYVKEPHSSLYFEQLNLKLGGEIDVKRFKEAWQRVIHTNEMLRAVFLWEKTKSPVQIILKDHPLTFKYFDFSDRTQNEKEKSLEDVKTDDRKETFHLDDVPFRVTLCKLENRSCELIISNHHILYDGWSNGIILKEFFDAYHDCPEPANKTRFKEYVKWVRQQDRESQKKYWKDYLNGIDCGTHFPVEVKGKQEDLRESGSLLFNTTFSKEMTQRLEAFVKQHKLTAASILYSAWGILLQRYTNKNDVLFGTTVSGRSAKIQDIEHMVGLFIQTPPLKVVSLAGETVLHLLNRIKETLQQREAYQYTPLVDIKTYSRVPHDEDLFNTIVVMENYPLDKELTRGNTNHRLTFQSYSLIGHTNYDLAIGILMGEHREIEVTFNYQSQLIDTKIVERLRTHFTRIIENLITYPANAVDEIDMLDEEEKNRLLYGFNNTEADYPRDKTIHRLFEEQVRKTPDLPAVFFENKHLTYETLNRKANQLAHRLRGEGVFVDTIVGILLEPGIERVVAMLAILKAGGAYLPIDPDLPLPRIVSMLEDCDAPVLLTSTETTAAGKSSFSFTLLKSLGQVRVIPRVTGVRPQVVRLDDFPIPDRSLVNYGKYMNRMGQAWVKQSIALLATRGCPYKCAYCHKVWPDKYVVRSAEDIFAEVKLYYDMGVRRFVIVDDIYNMDIKNSSKFFRLLIEKGLDVQLFFPSGMRGDILTRDYIDLMVKAGVVSVALALETASPRLQKLIGKHINIEKFRENLEYLCHTYPHVITELFTMHGFPTETEEEAMMTLDFIKSVKGIHFPYINILRIYSNTDMYRMAVENGISPQAIFNSQNLYFHEVPETLPFDKRFTRKYQADFLNQYFLTGERLLQVLPYQMKLLTEDEIIRKYNGYLEVEIGCFDDLLQMAGMSRDDLEVVQFLDEADIAVHRLDDKMKAHFSAPEPESSALRVLFLDLSQFFSWETNRLDNIYDAPLGMMYVMTYMNRRFGTRVKGRIAKSRVDFDSFRELKALLETFKPDIIGLRALTYYRDHFHRTAALIRQWGFDAPIVAGGPYATSDYNTILQDRNVDLAVVGEGEITFSELVERMLENGNKLPGQEVLNTIEGLAFVPDNEADRHTYSRQIILLDQSLRQLDAQPRENPEPAGQPGNLAYVMFTSGSMGKPKGVMIEHRQVVNNLFWFGKTFNLGSGTNLLQLSDYTFDPSVEDIFGSLVHGATLYLSDRDLILDRERFRKFIEDNEIHIIDHVPTMLDELLGTGERLESLQAVISGGMALEKAIKDRLIAKGYPLYNNYGPTEVTVDALFTRCEEGDVLLGKPIFNTRCYILDRHFRPAPTGVAGELCVAGDGVSRGYLNKPELTAEKYRKAVIRHSSFVIGNFKITNEHSSKLSPNDQCPMTNDRLYRTGDLCRWLPDGNIEFLGRIDRQLKIRGNRVELGEIEAQLRHQIYIKEALVTARGKEGDKYLCAYIVPHSPGVLTVGELRDYLSRYLPEYMVPAYFVLLKAFPLTPGGKIDTRALPEPERKGDGYIAPRNETEQKLVNIWSELLEIEPGHIGINNEFFSLGGHSIHAFRLISKIHREMNVKISITEIFNRPFIKDLAEYIKGAEENRFLSIQPVEEREYYPVSPAQKRMFIANRFKGKDISDNGTDVLMVEGDLDKLRFEAVMEQLVKRHESLRTSFQIINDKIVQRIHTAQDIELAVEYHVSDRPDIYDFLDHFVCPFNLGKAPLMRVALIKLTGEKHVLVMDAHHIIWDGGSKMVIMKELEDLYQGKELPALALQYRDFSIWQKRMLQSDTIKKQEEYWTAVFADEIPELHLPTDYQRPNIQSFVGDSVETHLPFHLREKVDELVLETGATHFMVLLAVFYILLSRCSDREDIIIGTPIAGRPHADLENIIGMFVNMLALRNWPEAEKTFKQFLEEVKKNCSSAYENQDYQFDNLVETLGIQRDSSKSALFDVVFAIHNRDADDSLEKNAHRDNANVVTFRNYRLKEKKAQFDIVFYVYVGERITLDFRYCKKLFKPSTVEKMVNRYIEILEQVTQEPDIRLKDISISFDLLAARTKVLDQVEFGF